MYEERLRKSSFGVELGYDNSNCDTISAEDARATVSNSAIIVKLTLKPGRGEKQRYYADYLLEHPHKLKFVQVTEEQVITELEKFLKHQNESAMHLHITYKETTKAFEVTPRLRDFLLQFDVTKSL